MLYKIKGRQNQNRIYSIDVIYNLSHVHDTRYKLYENYEIHNYDIWNIRYIRYIWRRDIK